MGCIESKRKRSSQFSISNKDNPDTSTAQMEPNNHQLENPLNPKITFVQEPMRRSFKKDLRPADHVLERRITLLRQLSGDPDKFDPKSDMKKQEKVIPYNSKREIDRSNFTIEEMIGSGNFGAVYKGTLTGLYKAKNKIPIAIKTKMKV